MAKPGVALKELGVKNVAYNGLEWIHIEKPLLAEMAYLRDRFPFHPLNVEDVLMPVHIPKLDEYADHLFLVVHFPVYDQKRRINIPVELDIFVGANYVVTIPNRELRPLSKLFGDCQATELVRNELMGSGSGFLLYRILKELTDYSFPIVNKLIDRLAQMEEQIFEGSVGEMIKELSLIRRDIISYRRTIRPQIEVLLSLERKDHPFLKLDPAIYFGDLTDLSRRIGLELDSLKEVAESLQDSHFALTTERTNDVVRILTVIATIMWPLVVVGGLYGMNVPLPLEDKPYAFGVILFINLLIAGLMLLFFRLRRWI